MSKRIYLFEEGAKEMKDLLGGKGANLAEMTRLGLPVPQGFTITTEACNEYVDFGSVLADELKEEIRKNMRALEELTGRRFNDKTNPLLVSVRSGAVFSMPGMMDTILNLGLNDEVVEGLATMTGNPRFAYDCYRRLLQMFGDVVVGIEKSEFEKELDHLKETKGYKTDADLTAEDWAAVCVTFKNLYTEKLGRPFPQSPEEQLFLSVEAVFRSWFNPRANIYRNLHKIPHNLGTAVNIQRMVFGNSGETSGTGVAFSRNPATGEKKLFGEYLLNAQGEDVVAGVRTPLPISTLKDQMPEIYKEFANIAIKLENHYKDMQDLEFTVENGILFILQTRNGKRTAKAAFQVASELVSEGLITKEEAILRIDPASVDQLLHPVFDAKAIAANTPIGKGLPASPGASVGKVYFDAAASKRAAERGEDVILVRQETSPEDIEGMIASKAIVTSRGGMTSHAAVVARGMGTCCVAGCDDFQVDEAAKTVTYPGGTLGEGDIISVDGTAGKIYKGEMPTMTGGEDAAFNQIMGWASEFSTMKIRTNADNAPDLANALHFGADGIGLTRTEHMFFAGDRLLEMRKMIVADSVEGRKGPLAALLPAQKGDFTAIYRLAKEKPVTIRLLDPPLHEFLPHSAEDIAIIAKEMNIDVKKLEMRVQELQESNPMLGHRGCRLAVTYPDIYAMQVEAIISSALELKKEGIDVKPEIMIPLIGGVEELVSVKAGLVEVIKNLLEKAGTTLNYSIGTMIEIPRACLTAGEIAENADFFSFGTNDLTQLTYGFSRDDAGKFLDEYIDAGILKADPFQTLDIEGVGQLIRMAVEKGRKAKPNLKIGVCGEVGGDPTAIEFFYSVGLDYVSCSPFRVPTARLASAQASIRAKK